MIVAIVLGWFCPRPNPPPRPAIARSRLPTQLPNLFGKEVVLEAVLDDEKTRSSSRGSRARCRASRSTTT